MKAIDVNNRKLVTHLVIHFVRAFVVITLALFLPAGTIRWIAGWCFLILFFGYVIVMSIWMLRYAPGLLQERLTGLEKSDQKAWDKMLISWWIVLSIAWLALLPLDAVRFHWSHMSGGFQIVGIIVMIASFYLQYLVFRENPYLSPAVRIQKERGQTLVSTGPYRYVRHPLYAAYIPLVMGTALLLGSWYGVLTGLILIGLIAIRALKEERTLLKELQGYGIYMAQVKYRFIPYVW